MEKRCRASKLFSRLLSLHVHVFTNPEELQTQSFWVVMEASLRRRSRLSIGQWRLIKAPVSLPSRRSGGEVGAESSTLKSQGWFSWQPVPQSALNERHLSLSHHLGNPKCFRSTVTEVGRKTKYTFLL